METLLLKAAKREETQQEIDYLKANYSEDLNIGVLFSQLVTFSVVMKDHSLLYFKDILTALKELKKHEKLLIGQVVEVAKLLQVNPATSGTRERSFSTARRIKMWMRSKMSRERFNNVCVLNIHKSRLDKINLVNVANYCIDLNENRHRNFGRFSSDDFKRNIQL